MWVSLFINFKLIYGLEFVYFGIFWYFDEDENVSNYFKLIIFYLYKLVLVVRKGKKELFCGWYRLNEVEYNEFKLCR